MNRNPSASFQDVYSVQTARIAALEVERDTALAKLAKCRESLRNTMGHISGEHPHWKAAFETLEQTK